LCNTTQKGGDILSPLSEAKKKSNAKYNAKAYDRLEIIVKKGEKDEWKAHADACGESLNGFVNRAMKETRQRDQQKIQSNGENI